MNFLCCDPGLERSRRRQRQQSQRRRRFRRAAGHRIPVPSSTRPSSVLNAARRITRRNGIVSDAVANWPRCKKGAGRRPFYFLRFAYLAALARRLFWRAAAFLWIKPLRDARSSSLTAAIRSSAVPPVARLSAVRSADFWARLRMAAARDFRMFFLAEARFGTN